MYEIQKKFTWSALKAGWVITLALFILFVTVFFSGNLASLFSPKEIIVARIKNVSGLRSGAPVWLYGVEIGTVKAVRLIASGTIVVISVNRQFMPQIYNDATARIQTMGLLGDRYIEITPGTSHAALAATDTIEGAKPPEIDEMVESGVASLDNVDKLITQIDSLVFWMRSGKGTVDQMIGNPLLYNRLSDAARTISQAARRLTDAQGSMKKFLDDPSLYNNLNQASEQLKSLLDGVGNGHGIAGELLNNGDLMKNLNATLLGVNALIADIRKDPRRYFTFELF